MSTFLRKGLLAALVIGLIIGGFGLSRAYNIRQNDDGTTDWVDPSASFSGGTPEIRVGRQYLTLRITDANNPITYYIVSPISGVLFSAFAVQNSHAISSITTNLTFGIQVPATPGAFVHPTTGAAIMLRPTQQQGTVFFNKAGTSGFSNTRVPFDVTRMEGNTAVRLGSVISIASGGEATDPGLGGAGAGEYDIIIIIDPR